jgi:hypothetical protein
MDKRKKRFNWYTWFIILCIAYATYGITRAIASKINTNRIIEDIRILTIFHPDFNEKDRPYLKRFFIENKGWWGQKVWTRNQHVKDENRELYNKLLQYNEKKLKELDNETNRRVEEHGKTYRTKFEQGL